jgi:hypothetical protein
MWRGFKSPQTRPSTPVTTPSLRLPGSDGAVATCEATTCMPGWSCLRATAKAAEGLVAIEPGPAQP